MRCTKFSMLPGKHPVIDTALKLFCQFAQSHIPHGLPVWLLLVETGNAAISEGENSLWRPWQRRLVERKWETNKEKVMHFVVLVFFFIKVEGFVLVWVFVHLGICHAGAKNSIFLGRGLQGFHGLYPRLSNSPQRPHESR